MSGWLPIETAPKDETEVLITDGTSFAVASYRPWGEWRDCGDMGWAGMCDSQPTHWMPLPPPPR